MEELGLTQDELARQLNKALLQITGRPGEISSRTIRNLLSGRHSRPIGRTCAALEHVFGCPVEELGFSAPGSMQRGLHPRVTAVPARPARERARDRSLTSKNSVGSRSGTARRKRPCTCASPSRLPCRHALQGAHLSSFSSPASPHDSG
ncbi:helix-turn-helix transcriptional regulator [Streptomyces sp. AK02-04a]|nr:helix-turn-helix transcriptional regulator [Streptomyces sp. AK02-04a]MDX3763354.1 helix-turn-helix transcriptional regulator [Streptomyces sp. AK02-04a]